MARRRGALEQGGSGTREPTRSVVHRIPAQRAQDHPYAAAPYRNRLCLFSRMNEPTVLATAHLDVCGAPDTIDPSADPPLLYAEDTYVVRSRTGGAVRPGLAGALTVPPGAREGRLRFGNFVGLGELDGRTVRVA